MVIMHLEAEVLQFFGMLSTVLETVQDDPDTGLRKGLDLVKNIYYTSVIGGVGNVKGNNMQIFC
jgi:hypothetical protein